MLEVGWLLGGHKGSFQKHLKQGDAAFLGVTFKLEYLGHSPEKVLQTLETELLYVCYFD